MQDRLSSIRLYCPEPLTRGAELSLDAAKAHYLAQVMRRKIGDRLQLFNGTDGAYLAEITALGKKQAVLLLHEQLAAPRQGPDIWLVFVPVKRARLDFIAQKATEMGVSKIWPVQSDYGQVNRLKDARLEANAIEAAEQTERLDIPDIGPFEPLSTLLDNWPSDRTLIFCDEALARTPDPQSEDESRDGPADDNNNDNNTGYDALSALKGQKAAILIGPEGGFSPAERKKITQLSKCLPLGLGPRILRADTAAIAALALYQGLAGDWS